MIRIATLYSDSNCQNKLRSMFRVKVHVYYSVNVGLFDR